MYKLRHIKSGKYFHNFGHPYYNSDNILHYYISIGPNGTIYSSLKKAKEILAKIDTILQLSHPDCSRFSSKDFVIVEFSPAFEIGTIRD